MSLSLLVGTTVQLLSFLFSAPTVCFNPLELRNGTHAYFICPEEGEDVTHTECCGPDYGQNCCKNYT